MKAETKDTAISYKELAFLLFYALMLFVKGMGLTDGQWPYELSLILGAVLVVCKLLLTDHTLPEWIAVLLLGALGVVIFFQSGERGALINIAVVIGMKDVSVKRVLKFSAVIFPLTFVAQMMLHLPHILPEFFKVQDKLGLGYIIRWSLGYPHPNVLQVSALVLCAIILYLGSFRGKRLLIVTACMLLFNLYIFLYSVSFTGIALAVLYLAANVYFTERKSFSSPEKGLMYAVFPVCLLFAVLGPLYIPEPLWGFFNKLLNTRFHIARTFMGMNPVTAFGVGWCNELPADLNNLDSSYVFALMHYGLIFFILFALGMTALIVYLVRKDMRKELAVVLCFSVAAVSEQFVVNSSFKNIAWVFVGAALFEGLSVFQKKVSKASDSSQDYERPGFTPFGLARIGEKTLPYPEEKAENLLAGWGRAFRENKKRILIIALSAAVTAMILFAVFYRSPSAYYVRLYDVQEYLWDRATYLDPDALPADFDGRILTRDADAETPLMIIDGKAVTLEKVRGIVSIGLWTAFWVIILEGIFIGFIKKPREL